MPTGTCRYPGHHSGPSAGPPIALVVAIAAGALIITHVGAVLVALAVVAALAALGGVAAMLLHSHRSVPYDAAWGDTELPAAVTTTLSVTPSSQLAARVAGLEAQLAERRAIEAPQQHLHLHGVSAEDLAAIVRRQSATVRPEIEER